MALSKSSFGRSSMNCLHRKMPKALQKVGTIREMILSYQPNLEMIRKLGIIIAVVGIIMVARIRKNQNLLSLNLYFDKTKPMIEEVKRMTTVSTTVTINEFLNQ